LFLRPHWEAVKVIDDTLPLGFHVDITGFYSLYSQIFEDDDGNRWQQTLYPAVADIKGLNKQASNISLDAWGILDFRFKGVDYHGQLDYLTTKSIANGLLRIKTNTKNGGNDVEIHYPNGQVQWLLR
jgi:hypothetical protein